MLIYNETELEKQARETTGQLNELFSFYESFRKQYEERAINCYKHLVGYLDETEEDKKARENGEPVRSNLFIPRTYQIIDTIRSRYLMAIFNKRPYLEFIPIPSRQLRFLLQEAEDKANVAASLVDEQLEKNNIVAKFYDYITSVLTFPAGVLGVGWRYEEAYVKRKVPMPQIVMTPMGPQYTGRYVYEVQENIETVWDDNEVVNIDFFDFWPDPKGNNIDDCRGVFQREFVTKDELVQRLHFLELLDEGAIYLKDIKELDEIPGGESFSRGREDRLAEIGMTGDMPEIFSQSRDEGLRDKKEFELLHWWENNRHAMLINRDKCIYDGPSPYWRHRKKPFIVSSFDRLPNEFYGQSAIEILYDLQEEENTIHNQRSDNVNFIINKMWKVRRGADIDDSELISRPHGIIHVDRMDDVEELQMQDVAASSFNQQNFVSHIMENTLATPPVIRGADSAGDKTATETLKQTTNAGMRFDVKILLFRSLDIKRLAYLMDMNNQQFINEERLVRIGVDKGMKWRMITPGDLIGERDYRPAGANVDPAANKEVRREQLSHMMQFFMQTGVPFVDYYKLIEEWLQSFDIENAEKFLVPQQEAMQQMLLMQQMMGQEGFGTSTARQQANTPTVAQQTQNAQTGRARGRRPQTERNPSEQATGVVR